MFIFEDDKEFNGIVVCNIRFLIHIFFLFFFLITIYELRLTGKSVTRFEDS